MVYLQRSWRYKLENHEQEASEKNKTSVISLMAASILSSCLRSLMVLTSRQAMLGIEGKRPTCPPASAPSVAGLDGSALARPYDRQFLSTSRDGPRTGTSQSS